MRLKQKVVFIPRDKETTVLLDHPRPAKKYVPEWFKKLPSSWISANGWKKSGPSNCLPFLDSFTNGYIHELPCDLEIKNEGIDKDGNDIVRYTWSGSIRPVQTRFENEGAPSALPTFDGYYSGEFQWFTSWDPKTPTGYSTIYHHPSNRFDLPFMTYTGIVDTDKWSGHGPVPFLLKRGFEGIIPAGTPIIQFSFIKRESWSSTAEKYDEYKHAKIQYKLKRHFYGAYKKFYWSRKDYI